MDNRQRRAFSHQSAVSEPACNLIGLDARSADAICLKIVIKSRTPMKTLEGSISAALTDEISSHRVRLAP